TFEVRRDTEDAPAFDGLGVLHPERLEGSTAPRLGSHRVGIEAGGRDRSAQLRFVVELLAVLVADAEQREVRVLELLGELIAHRDAVEQREHSRAPLVGRALPHGGLTLLDVHLVEREGHVADVQLGATADRGDHGRMAVVREGSAVVERDSDLAAHGGPPGSLCPPYPPPSVPMRGCDQTCARATRPSAIPSAVPATTSERWCMRVYTRLNATNAASVNQAGAAASSRESTTAHMNAVAAWPDGNDDVMGRRMP